MVKKVSGKDRVEAALQDAADALKKDADTPRTLRSSSRQNSNTNSKSNSRNTSAVTSPAKDPRGVSSADGTLAEPPRLSRASNALRVQDNTVLTPREKANHERDAALAAGDRPAKEKLAREQAAREKAAELKAAKAAKKEVKAKELKAAELKASKAKELKAAELKASRALKRQKAAKLKAAKALEEATQIFADEDAAEDAAEEQGSSSVHVGDGEDSIHHSDGSVHLSDVSSENSGSDGDGSFVGSDKAAAKRKRRIDSGQLDGSESEGELLPSTQKNKTKLPRADPRRRQPVPATVPKRSKASAGVARSNSVPLSTNRRQVLHCSQKPPASPAFVQVGSPDTARDAGEKAVLFAAVREAYADIGPHDPPRPPFSYWDPEKVYSCANKVIARTPLLQTMAQRYNRRNDFAKKHGQAVRTHANNERSAQIRTMKAMWLNNESYISLLNYDESVVPVKISVSRDLQSFESVEGLREVLFSASMYTHPVLYNFICLGLESGNFKGTTACGITTISDLITPAHEAHFRVELWYALPYHGYRHSISTTHAKERMAKWTEFLPFILKDRKDNEIQAHQTRQNLALTGVPADDEADDDNPDDEAGSQYW